MRLPVWTGAEMIVWGGSNHASVLNDGAYFGYCYLTYMPVIQK